MSLKYLVAAALAALLAAGSGQLPAAQAAPAPGQGIVINEIATTGGTPGDWVELVNPGTAAVDLSGWILKDNDDTHSYAIPSGTSIAGGGFVVLDESSFGYALGAADSVRLYLADGTTVVDSYTWTSHATTTYGRCPSPAGQMTTTVAPTKGAANQCLGPVAVSVVINEVVSTGATPDAVELVNTGSTPANLAGFRLSAAEGTVTLPVGTVVPAQGYLVLTRGTAFPFDLGAVDTVRLLQPDAVTVVDSVHWTLHGTPSWARCPNGTGPVEQSRSVTLGAANDCVPQPATQPWPGGPSATVVDTATTFLNASSGLDVQIVDGLTYLWAVDNGTGRIWKLIMNPDGTVKKPAAGWESGKRARFATDTATSAGPDTEGITVAGDGFLYLASERNNAVKDVSSNKILKIDPHATTADIVASQEWDLTSALPKAGANTGMEAVEWVPDSALAGRLWDQRTGAPYAPAAYAGHGTGLFLVGVEGDGGLYAFALNQDGTSTLISRIETRLRGVMALDWDTNLGVLWAVCDDSCSNTSAQVTFTGAAHPAVVQITKPAGLLVANFEGFATSPRCTPGTQTRPVWWFQDGIRPGSLRVGTLPCAEPTPSNTPTPSPSPVAPLPDTGADVDVSQVAWTILALLVGSAMVVAGRRR